MVRILIFLNITPGMQFASIAKINPFLFLQMTFYNYRLHSNYNYNQHKPKCKPLTDLTSGTQKGE